MAYVLRVLESYPPERVTFFMPQLVQILRHDDGKLVEGYLLRAAQRNDIFAHILIWHLQGETVPEAGKDPNSVKNGSFLELLPAVRQHIIDGFNPKALDIFKREFDFFDKVTSISGVLYPLPKEERRAGIKRELEKIELDGEDLYLPTATTKLVTGIQVDSGIPLQSAANPNPVLRFPAPQPTSFNLHSLRQSSNLIIEPSSETLRLHQRSSSLFATTSQPLPLHSVPSLHPKLKSALEDMGISSLFPVQVAVWHNSGRILLLVWVKGLTVYMSFKSRCVNMPLRINLHSRAAGTTGHQATRNWVASIIKEKLKACPDYKPKDIVNDIKQEYGIQLNYFQAGKDGSISTQLTFVQHFNFPSGSSTLISIAYSHCTDQHQLVQPLLLHVSPIQSSNNSVTPSVSQSFSSPPCPLSTTKIFTFLTSQSSNSQLNPLTHKPCQANGENSSQLSDSTPVFTFPNNLTIPPHLSTPTQDSPPTPPSFYGSHNLSAKTPKSSIRQPRTHVFFTKIHHQKEETT
ncbi:unnamed protein product [Vicia faba]|uniref:1-phosphatidylinositol 4-kinase n=1 Tax=Vicia faba TaxID=3906 RepID=A0AAV0Z7U0_VICFA|nr:unnamed protein product [Vicia faba]